jgi:glutathione synthase/RimK-type ligase-like ATP-grasp enzyme
MVHRRSKLANVLNSCNYFRPKAPREVWKKSVEIIVIHRLWRKSLDMIRRLMYIHWRLLLLAIGFSKLIQVSRDVNAVPKQISKTVERIIIRSDVVKTKQIAFVTSREYPDLTADDRVAGEGLASEGVRVVPAIWNEPSISWEIFDLIIVRSCWDYYKHPETFREWINSMDGFPVWNRPEILRWNMEKGYLFDLERKGIRIPRTIILPNGDQFDAHLIHERMGMDYVVIKPAISASAWQTWKCSLIDLSGDDRSRLKDLSTYADIIVQEFMPEIVANGEWSFVFFGDSFSHAVRKYPRQDDFRVQKEMGGSYHFAQSPPAHLILQAQKIVDIFGEELLYARVDCIERNGELILVELELIEPQLFFDVHPEGVRRFMERLRQLVS